MRDPLDVLLEGAKILAPVLGRHGYCMDTPETGKSSGGPMAVGRWRSGPRSVETHVRTGLGIVEYKWDNLSLSHADCMRAQGLKGSFPGFSSDPVEGFAHLAADLEGPAASILDCGREEFEGLVGAVRGLPRRQLP